MTIITKNTVKEIIKKEIAGSIFSIYDDVMMEVEGNLEMSEALKNQMEIELRQQLMIIRKRLTK